MAPQSGRLIFPREIISNVIDNLDLGSMTNHELICFWMTARLVSKQFLNEVPLAYREVLPQVTLEYKSWCVLPGSQG